MHTMVSTGRKFMGRLAQGDDLLLALEKLARAHGLKLGEVRALGSVSKARLGYYDQAAQKFEFFELDRPLEILALVGNLSLKDDQPLVHAHLTLADKDGRALGGHLAEGTIVFACEFVIQEYQSAEPMVRQFDAKTGLSLWPTPS